MCSKKPKEKQRSIFDVCFPCFSKTIHCDDLVCHAYGKDFTDYEYVIENLAIKRIPKAYLEERKVCPGECNPNAKKKSSGHRVKKVPPEISIGPISRIKDATPEEICGSRTCKICGPCVPTFPSDAINETTCPAIKRAATSTKNYYVETHPGLDDNIIRQILNPNVTKPNYEKPKSGKMQVSVDIHTTDKEEEEEKPRKQESPKVEKTEKTMPTEIKETIEALKVAKPHTSEYPPRNRRSLIRTVSTTSCDKETSCNFYDLRYIVDSNSFPRDLEGNLYKEGKNPQQKKRPSSPMKYKSSSSTSNATPFPDIIECEEKESYDLQSTENSATSEQSQKGQSLKWKIIINKHKKDNKN